jgi:hypothetical protein
MAKFQMVDSTSPYTIADVSSVVDIESFRKDINWYEVLDEVLVVRKTTKTVKQPKLDKDEE